MAHDKVYGICESKCKVEVPSLEKHNGDISNLETSMYNLSESDRDFLTKKILLNMGKEVLTSCNRMYKDKTEITTIDYIETYFVTNMSYMFNQCTSLTSIPNLDTSNVTNISAMFSVCTSLTSIPNLDTSNVTDMSAMFNKCTSLTSIPNLNTSNVKNMGNLFRQCTNLTSIPDLNTSNVTNIDYMFDGCTNLTSIPDLDINKVKYMTGTLNGCTSLTTFTDNTYAPEGQRWQIKNNVDFSPCPLDRTSILKVFNGLETVSSKTIKISSTTNSYLTDEDKAIATNKGWTIEVL